MCCSRNERAPMNKEYWDSKKAWNNQKGYKESNTSYTRIRDYDRFSLLTLSWSVEQAD